MFRGFSTASLDKKGRLAIPARYRDRLAVQNQGRLVLTLSPLDRALWLYPLAEWESIEPKLAALSDFDPQARRTKQMMRGYAGDHEPDVQGRILIPQELREHAQLERVVVILGQGNKFEIWDQKAWNAQRDQWLQQVGDDAATASSALTTLSL
jgi:MraZ protein